MTIIRKMSFDELAAMPEFEKLTQDYADESKIEEMPEHCINHAAYRAMEQAGMYHLFGAINDDKLVGLVCVLVTPVPHYSVKIASTESIFVDAAHRKGGTGLKLLKVAEDCAREHGADHLFISAPMGGRLVQVLPRVGYRECQRIFCRRLS